MGYCKAPDHPISMLNRADLLRCLQKLGADGLKQAAPLMGYGPEPMRDENGSSKGESSTISQPGVEQDIPQTRPSHATFYRLTKREPLRPVESSSQTQFPRWFRETADLDLDSVTRQSCSLPPFTPLIPWSALWVFLKKGLSVDGLSVKPDIPKLINRIAQGEHTSKIPRMIHQAWSVAACILVDYNDRVVPFHQDFTYLVQQLKKMRGSSGLRVLFLCNKPGGPVRYYRHKQEITEPWQMPEPETPLIILSDLGLYDTTGIARREWIGFSRQLRSAGCYPLALIPVPTRYRSKEIEKLFHCVTWDRGSRLDADMPVPHSLSFSMSALDEDGGAKQLLVLLALAIRIEPALLRAARYLPLPSRYDVGSEAAAWLHADVIQSSLGFYYRQEVIARYQTAFSKRLPALQIKPSWAENLARDQYGLYTEFTYKAVTQRLRWINPGRFEMGSPLHEIDREENETLHEVTLTRGFWLADTACTQALWQAMMGENPSESNQGDHYPVENVSWDDVNVFLERINRQIPDLALRLPTEAEWEYACRARSRTPFSFGENITTDQVNYDGNYPYAGGNKGERRGKTVEVKALPANNWGLYQMHGNVWEWCYDWYGEYPARPVTDPTGSKSGDSRVLRGGGWIGDARHARSAYRSRVGPAHRGIFIVSCGFRLARGPQKQDKQAGQ